MSPSRVFLAIAAVAALMGAACLALTVSLLPSLLAPSVALGVLLLVFVGAFCWACSASALRGAWLLRGTERF